MRKRKYIINLFAVAALLVGCGESLEDTYSDYAGDGPVRYAGKCTDVKVVYRSSCHSGLGTLACGMDKRDGCYR